MRPRSDGGAYARGTTVGRRSGIATGINMIVGSATGLGVQRFQVKAVADNHFGWICTRLAVERTMLAWVRTAITLIGFGFAIVEVFEQLDRLSGVAPAPVPSAPFYVGLVLIGSGIATLVISGWRYGAFIRHLRDAGPTAIAGGPTRTPAYVITIAVIFIGVFAFLAVATRAL